MASQLEPEIPSQLPPRRPPATERLPSGTARNSIQEEGKALFSEASVILSAKAGDNVPLLPTVQFILNRRTRSPFTLGRGGGQADTPSGKR